MTYTTLITAEQLQALQASAEPALVFDCSFALMQPDAGAAQYHAAHIPGARYVHLDTDLSLKPGAIGAARGADTVGAADGDAAARPASGGRHPLPGRERFAQWAGQAGLANGRQAVVYDRNGCNYCGRLWWMLKWLGHDAVAVLDGGLQAWQAAGGEVQAGDEPPPSPARFVPGAPLVALLDTATVAARLGMPAQTLIDARAAARYRGEEEPLDPIAGHIPGALNRPFGENLGPDGRFKPAAQLRAEFEALLGNRDPASVVHHCGSGVSAIPNLLAMQVAGLGATGLYAGSWSEWSNTPGLPTRQGAEQESNGAPT